MKTSLLVLLFASTTFTFAQRTATWPDDWLGTWKGELFLERPGQDSARSFAMALEISATERDHVWNWVIIYGEGEKQDRREYLLIAQDSIFSHFVMDEQNSILLDQYRIGNRMYSRFSVDSTMLVSVSKVEGDVMEAEIWTGPLAGKKTGESLPEGEQYDIFSFPLKSVQTSRLFRQK
ncbi:MAG: hypothetical protein R3B47_04975 [Bacteroidia bacterium]